VRDEASDTPQRAIEARAPIRICDFGGWTDTWFAGHGTVLSLAVEPGATVRIAVWPRGRDERVELCVDDFGERYGFDPSGRLPGRHPLLEAAVADVGVPPTVDLEITIGCAAPAGASTGTSAAVTVALVAALDALTPGRSPAQAIAARAHRVETERLGLQSGVQDQLCAAHGGICFIDMHEYPDATVCPVHVADDLRRELDDRLLLVFLGRSHVSSDVHDRVIERLAAEGFDSPELDALRAMADRARGALVAGDLAAFGQAMWANTELQRGLHPELVSAEADAVADVARRFGALGCKVNGAGGEGGSVTVLGGPDAGQRAALAEAITGLDPSFRLLPVRLSRTGVVVAEAPTPADAIAVPEARQQG
jgi:D-glycero-alpha-D-manno-heptose-7-phosphate kinase